MGFLSGILGGGEVKMAARPKQEKSLYGIAQQAGNESAAFGAGNAAVIARAMDPRLAMQRARGIGNVDTQIATKGAAEYSPNDPNIGLARALSKGSALSRIAFAGADLAKRQGFDNLAAIAGNGSNLRNIAIGGLQTGAGVSATRTAADMTAAQTVADSKANMLGSIMGGVAGGVAGKFGGSSALGATRQSVFENSNMAPLIHDSSSLGTI